LIAKIACYSPSAISILAWPRPRSPLNSLPRCTTAKPRPLTSPPTGWPASV